MCGIVGGYMGSGTLRKLLGRIQHRGFHSCGVVTDEGAWHAEGLVSNLPDFMGKEGLGHVRYVTNNDPRMIQPFVTDDCQMVFNGQVEDGDTARLFMALREGFRGLRDIRGAYSVIWRSADGRFFAARDPFGFRPLVYNSRRGIAASEPVADLDWQWEPVPPGCIVNLTTGQCRPFARPKPYPCFFEHVYFGHVSSYHDHMSVYNTRRELGFALAKREDIRNADMVVPVPNSGIAAAEAMAEYLNIPLRLGIVQNRQATRTFIAERGQTDKYTLTPHALYGRILVLDDSIVRGSTMRTLVPRLKRLCDEVHLRITCPPITHACRYGVNITGAGAHHIEGADSIRFMEPDDFVGCKACVTGEYPDCNASIEWVDPPTEWGDP